MGRVEVRIEAGRAFLEGEFDRRCVGPLNERIGALPARGATLELDLHGLDIADSDSSLAAVDWVRMLLMRFGRVRLYGTPQLLAHALYRVGMLEGTHPALELTATREEEGYG